MLEEYLSVCPIRKIKQHQFSGISIYTYLKPNPEKWHLILIEDETTFFVKVRSRCIFNSESKKVLAVCFDNKVCLSVRFLCQMSLSCVAMSGLKVWCLGLVIGDERDEDMDGETDDEREGDYLCCKV